MRLSVALAGTLALSLCVTGLSRAQERDKNGAPRFEHIQWKSDVAFAWSGGVGKEAKKLYVAHKGAEWKEWSPENVPSYVEDVTAKEAALELAFHFYPGWGELVTPEQWKKTQELCTSLGIPSVDAPKGSMWIKKQGPPNFDTKIVATDDGFKVTYVAWRWREIWTIEVNVLRNGKTTLVSRDQHMLVDHPVTGQKMADAPMSEEERVSWAFLDGIKKIYGGGWRPIRH